MKYNVIENEIWKTVEQSPFYEVSNLGRIRRMKKGGYIEIKPCKNGVGYYYVCLSGHKMFLVHRLVATAFIPNPKNLSDINHINEDKSDCRVENLEWCTHRDNCM